MKNNNKPIGQSRTSAAKTLYALMQYMKKNGGCVAFRDLKTVVPTIVKFNEWELEEAGKMKYIRWWAQLQFYSVDYAKAGYLVKKDGIWYITPEGEEALKMGEIALMLAANAAYRKWKKQQDLSEADNEEETQEEVEKENTLNLEELESKAREGIFDHIRGKNPYDFQFMVAALLHAMGYYTPFVAPKGKDGGVDIIAYQDPIGAKTPRIKVQVKHYPDSVVGADAVRSLRGVLDDEGDIGLFVTSGTFSADARRETLKGTRKFIKLIDGDEFINLWEQYYDKMADEDKNMLPLKRIAFLGSNE